MVEQHKFDTPRNIFEKLIRDSEKLDKEVSGDQMFNFISTACHLKQWIENSPLISSEIVKRFDQRLDEDPRLKRCGGILKGTETFEVNINHTDKKSEFKIGDITVDAIEFKNEIMELYSTYFKLKGS